MSNPLPELTRSILMKGALEDGGYDELINYYAVEMTPQQRAEFSNSVNRLLENVIAHTLTLSDGTPSDAMAIYNAGVAEGFDEGFEQGRRAEQRSIDAKEIV